MASTALVVRVSADTAPVLFLRNVTQTTVTIEWEPLQLAHADILSLDVMRNGERIARVPQPLVTTSTKLSGLSIDTEYAIQLMMHTTAGSYVSNEVRTRTCTLDDMSGVHVCIGSIPDASLDVATKTIIEAMGAHWSNKMELETTHLVCMTPPSASDESQQKMYEKAQLLSLPIVQPHWLFACRDAQRYVHLADPSMVPISPYYLDGTPPNAQQVQEQLHAPTSMDPKGPSAPSPESAEPAESAKPAEPASPAEPTGFVESAKPMDPSELPAPDTPVSDTDKATVTEAAVDPEDATSAKASTLPESVAQTEALSEAAAPTETFTSIEASDGTDASAPVSADTATMPHTTAEERDANLETDLENIDLNDP